MRDLNLIEIMTPFICFGLVSLILGICFYTYAKFRFENLKSIIFLLVISALFLLLESLFVFNNYTGGSLALGMQITRVMELVLVFFLPALPYFLSQILEFSPGVLKRANQYLIYLGLVVSVFIFIIAFIFPDLFISVTKGMDYIDQQILAGRGREGILYRVRDVYNSFLMIFTLVLLLVVKKKKKEHISVKYVLVGIIATILISSMELYNNFTGVYLFIPRFYGQLFDYALSIFSYSVFLGFLSYFMTSVKNTQQLKNDLQKKQEELFFHAHYDSLTHFYNRRYFLDQFESYFQQDKPFGVILLTIEGYLDLNEVFGNRLSDAILKEAAHRIKENSRGEKDLLFRFGNRDFAIIIPELPGKDFLIRYTEVLHSQLSQMYLIEDHQYYANASAGILYLPEDAENFDDALKSLFSALRAAKHKKNTMEFFNEEMRARQQKRALIAHRIRESLNNKDFYVLYQPIVDSLKRIVAAEALIRWKDGFFPDDFIPLAESAGLMHELGSYILNSIILDIINNSSNMSFPVHINLSPAQFTEDDFASQLIARLIASNISPAQVAFEVTESFMILDEEQTVSNLQELKNNGFSVALDDFGTGYSSLSYLSKLPIDTLKIDKSFVSKLLHSEKNRLLVQSIVDLGHHFHFKLIAEGVENEEVLEKLKELKVENFQGYYFYKPLSITEILEL